MFQTNIDPNNLCQMHWQKKEKKRKKKRNRNITRGNQTEASVKETPLKFVSPYLSILHVATGNLSHTKKNPINTKLKKNPIIQY